MGHRYNIVSGALGTIATNSGSTDKTFGWVYPDVGVITYSIP